MRTRSQTARSLTLFLLLAALSLLLFAATAPTAPAQGTGNRAGAAAAQSAKSKRAANRRSAVHRKRTASASRRGKHGGHGHRKEKPGSTTTPPAETETAPPSSGSGTSTETEGSTPPPSSEGTGGSSGGTVEETTTPPPTVPPSETESGIEIPADARYVSATSGSDSNAGTATSPWRTLAKAASTAGPGDVVVLLPGTYGAMGTTTNLSKSGAPGAPITFTSMPGRERAVVKGYVRISGSHIVVDSLVFDGPTGQIVSKTSSNPGGEEVQVSVMYGSDVEIAHSEVRDNAWHAGVFIYGGSEIRIVSNYIHDNGDAATGANLDHGVYWCGGSGRVTGNLIENNVAYGIQLYPEANNVVVAHNKIIGNDRGGIIVASSSSQNQLNENVVAYNAQYGIRSYELSGTGNVARNNVLWKNGEDISGSSISFSGTLFQDPQTLTAQSSSTSGARIGVAQNSVVN